jgi:DNA-binding MarR family transcriptional regulator
VASRLATPACIAEDRGFPRRSALTEGETLATEAKDRRSTTRASAFGVALEDLMGYNLRRAHGVQKQRFAAVFGPLGIRPVTLSVLGTILDHPGITQADLSKRLNIKRANMVPVMAELEGRGLIARRQSPKDRRAHVITLTPAGRKFTKRLLDLHERLEEDLARSLGPRERDQLLVLLKRFRRLATDPDLPDDDTDW